MSFRSSALRAWIASAAGSPVARNTLLMLVVVVAGLVVLTRIGEKRWRAAGLDLDGREAWRDAPAPRARAPKKSAR
jgi:hypothetical protein